MVYPPAILFLACFHEQASSFLEPSFDLDDYTAARVHTLIAEGALRRGCTALTADPPVAPTPDVVDELRLLHPGPAPVHRDMIEKLRRCCSRCWFWPCSSRSGNMCIHLWRWSQRASSLASSRSFAVVLMMMREEIPEDVRRVCGASLMALRKPNESFRPVAGKTLRRLCSKVCVELMGSSLRSILEPIQVGAQTKVRLRVSCSHHPAMGTHLPRPP